jgi:predicted ArsR family transcriptional regulator
VNQPRAQATLESAQIAPLCSLGDPTRRRLYEYVAATREPVTRDQASAALQVDRSLVAYHLDKLVDEGLLAASFARPEGRGGPGAGRPAKHYQRADREFTVSVPPRDYRLVAELLARAAETDTSGTVRRALEHATELGRELAAANGVEHTDDLVERITRQGFEPLRRRRRLRLSNCPFRQLADEHTELVCGMNLAMLTGVIQAPAADVRPRLDPAPDRCCVVFDHR